MNFIIKSTTDITLRKTGRSAMGYPEDLPYQHTGSRRPKRKRLRKVMDDLMRISYRLVYHVRLWIMKFYIGDPWYPVFRKIYEGCWIDSRGNEESSSPTKRLERTALMIILTGSKEVFFHLWELFSANSGRNNKLSYKIKHWILLKLLDIRP